MSYMLLCKEKTKHHFTVSKVKKMILKNVLATFRYAKENDKSNGEL